MNNFIKGIIKTKMAAILAGVFGLLVLKGSKDETSDVKALIAKSTKPISIDILKIVQKKLGFVPLWSLQAASKYYSNDEKTYTRQFLYKIFLLYSRQDAANMEKILRSETSNFTSLLFRSTRNVGGILGHDICLYINNVNGRNLISNTKNGKKYCYRTYTNINDALIDLENVLKAHDWDLVKYSGNTVSQSYWDSISTPIVNSF